MSTTAAEKIDEEKITIMNDIREIIQKTLKEKGLNPAEVAKELNPRKNG